MAIKVRFPKILRNILISIVALLALAVGAGVAYTWYMGQSGASNTSVAAPSAAESAPVIKHTQSSPNAKVGLAVRMITSPVVPGSNASITVATNTEAKCTISVIYDQTASKDSGLAPKVADEYGIVSWTWTVEPTVPLGKWPVKVICANNSMSGMVQGDLQVSKSIQ